MVWAQNQPGYPNIFDAANCSLISQLLPANAKKFLADFMDGNAFRNPIQQVGELLQGKLGELGNKADVLRGLSDIGQETSLALRDVNTALTGVNNEMNAFLAHTNRLSGVSIGGDNGVLPRLDQIIGVMSSYNSIKDLLKNPGDLLEDNFSNAFSSLNPQITGPLFENFGSNMNQLSTVLANIETQAALGNLVGLAVFTGQLRQLTNNLASIQSNIQSLINGDIDAFNVALAFVERYALGNSLISSALTDPCFGAQLAKNLILNPDFSKGLDDIAAENGVKIEGSPVNLLDFVPGLK